MLQVEVQRRLGAFAVNVAFRGAGGVTALFGQSGAGKSSIVAMIAGLLRPDRGRIAVADRVLFDHSAGVNLAPHRRALGYIFQEGRLFPHLSVRQNLVYGRWFTPPARRWAQFDQVVALLGIEHLLARRPGLLSGGEKQRVAIGRALLASPRLLLMDEPLASLDSARKAEILPFIERLRDQLSVPIVYVSHALEEVARLATTVVVLADGRVEAAGPVAEVMSRLDLGGSFEAGALIETRVGAHDRGFGLTRLDFAGGCLAVPLVELPEGAALRVRIRARDVALALERPHGLSVQNIVAATVREIREQAGAHAELRLDAGGVALLSQVTRAAVAQLGLQPGQPVYALIKSVALDRRSLGLISRDAEGEPALSKPAADHQTVPWP